MLSIYLDRSADVRVTVVAGYISETKLWFDFQAKWLDWLHQFSVSEFHMREFAQSVGGYATWKGQHTKRREFLEGLIRIIQAYTFHSFAGSVLADEFKAFIALPQMERLFGNEFTLCARACAGIFEHGHSPPFETLRFNTCSRKVTLAKGKLIEIMERDGFPTPVFQAKKPQLDAVFTPFQAADFAAWEVRKALGQVEAGAAWDDLRESMKALSFGPQSWSHHSKDNLEETARLHLMDAASGLSEQC